jgi:hypothetical protein
VQLPALRSGADIVAKPQLLRSTAAGSRNYSFDGCGARLAGIADSADDTLPLSVVDN